MAYPNSKLHIVAVGGKQVNADWLEQDPNDPAYIKNKPNITGGLHYEVVEELPTEDIDPNCIYMILRENSETDNYYDEYMYIEGSWELIGSTATQNIQADFDETDPSNPAYINNKPDTLDFIVPFTEVSDVISTTVSKADIIAAMNAGKTVRATLNGQFYELVAYTASPEKMSFSTVIEDTTVSIIGKIVNDNWVWGSYETELNVQADWDETDASSPAYINNKPDLSSLSIEENQELLPFYLENVSDSSVEAYLKRGATDAPYYYQPPTINLKSSSDNNTWTSITFPSTGDITITIPAKSRVYFKGNNTSFCSVRQMGTYVFLANWWFDCRSTNVNDIFVGGNMMSLLLEDFDTHSGDYTIDSYAFGQLLCHGDTTSFSAIKHIEHIEKLTCSLPYRNQHGNRYQLKALTNSFFKTYNKNNYPLDLSKVNYTSGRTPIADNVYSIIVNPSISDLSVYSSTPNNVKFCYPGGTNYYDYNKLLNKPTIPTVNDATITIQQGGVTVGTFTTNDDNNTTIDLAEAPKSWYGTENEFVALELAGQLRSDTNYFINGELARVATTGSYTDLTNRPNLATVATSGEYSDLKGALTAKENVVLGSKQTDWYGTKTEFDALEQAGLLDWYKNYYIEGTGEVQADWSESDTTDPSYIQNKPTNMVFGNAQGTPTSFTIRTISAADYANLPSYDSNTVYLVY